MGYLALYRKYRPLTFDTVYGQEPIVRTLCNQIKSGRHGHAYLFSGPRGTGKTTMAKILSKALNCLSPISGSPCCKCDNCQAIANGTMDVVEIDAASNNGVNDIRDIIDEAKYAPQDVKVKVYIIDEVHMLSKSAFDALLKTLEEPPDGVVFILATTELYKVPATIMSRCQIYDFKLLDTFTTVDALQDVCLAENTEFENEAISIIAKRAEGSMRDALSLLDQVIQFCDDKITVEDVRQVLGEPESEKIEKLADAIENDEPDKALDILSEMYNDTISMAYIADALYMFFRNKAFNDKGNMHFNLRCMETCAGMSVEMRKAKFGSMAYVSMQAAIMRLCKPEMDNDYDSLCCRLQKLEQAFASQNDNTKETYIPPEPIDRNEFCMIKYIASQPFKLHMC